MCVLCVIQNGYVRICAPASFSGPCECNQLRRWWINYNGCQWLSCKLSIRFDVSVLVYITFCELLTIILWCPCRFDTVFSIEECGQKEYDNDLLNSVCMRFMWLEKLQTIVEVCRSATPFWSAVIYFACLWRCSGVWYTSIIFSCDSSVDRLIRLVTWNRFLAKEY